VVKLPYTTTHMDGQVVSVCVCMAGFCLRPETGASRSIVRISAAPVEKLRRFRVSQGVTVVS